MPVTTSKRKKDGKIMDDPETSAIRILAVDDEEEVLESYREILGSDQDDLFSELDSRAGKLFGDSHAGETRPFFELVTCTQGDEAVEQVKAARKDGRPFSVAFIDVRMPPGPGGDKVAQRIHDLDPRMNIVIVTAYSDVPPQEIARKFRIPSRLFYIQKPFHWNEIYQFARALGENWKIHEELTHHSDLLEELAGNQVAALNTSQEEMLAAQETLQSKTKEVEEINVALRVLLNERDRSKEVIAESIMFNINEYVAPYLYKLRNTDLTIQQELIVSTIEKNLKSLTSSFSSRVAPKQLNFTPVELQVAKLIKHGRSSKEIAELLNLSILTIESYRKNIRKKMGLTNKRQNLRTMLLEYM